MKPLYAITLSFANYTYLSWQEPISLSFQVTDLHKRMNACELFQYWFSEPLFRIGDCICTYDTHKRT